MSRNPRLHGFGTLVARADNMRYPSLSSVTPGDDPLLLSQLTSQLDITMNMGLQPQTSPEFWVEWLARSVTVIVLTCPQASGLPQKMRASSSPKLETADGCHS
ncbi:hypothetical protein ASPBRDRAFT_49674 [Aspergillus brasiliensis CBS 101740]|uniref:Uncharacterized protein n=1 Tax=Aspergillus brasiliensis (strain CBS 101740 / IMI 381727 / IBT 21946) TaxID=767769 RepID=A0A1L9U1M0_ASPBC|nr:hypothetical protein ASPBRDRAFT_49674 [Aspergillus brasiliensis CBS 101740]